MANEQWLRGCGLGQTLRAGVLGDVDSGSGAGAAYVFVRGGASGSQQQKLLAGSGSAKSMLGDRD